MNVRKYGAYAKCVPNNRADELRRRKRKMALKKQTEGVLKEGRKQPKEG